MQAPHLLDTDNEIVQETEALHQHLRLARRRRTVVGWMLFLSSLVLMIAFLIRAGMDYQSLPLERNYTYVIYLAELVLGIGLSIASFGVIVLSLRFFLLKKEWAFLQKEAKLEAAVSEQITFWRWLALGFMMIILIGLLSFIAIFYIKSNPHRFYAPKAEWESDAFIDDEGPTDEDLTPLPIEGEE